MPEPCRRCRLPRAPNEAAAYGDFCEECFAWAARDLILTRRPPRPAPKKKEEPRAEVKNVP